MGKQSVDAEVCPCCRYRTGYGTCPVCFWTRGGQEDPEVSVIRDGPNGDLTLADAQLNFAIYGASHPRYRDMVRLPRPDEQP